MSRVGVATWSERERPAPGWIERVLERAVAVGYGATYDAVVEGFVPYDELLNDIVDALDHAGDGRPLRVLDVACGTGTVAEHLARAGHTVIGLDMVAHLVSRARRREGEALAFGHADVAAGTGFAAGTFDACVSLHTLNWHPRPLALLRECRRVLRPGGHAIILSYTRPVSLRATFRSVRASDGLGAAVAALRWLGPTAVFEACRHYDARYPDPDALHRELATAGFDIVESRPAFLAGVSRLVWARRAESHPEPSLH
jgi:ubiquinone/menaquinone biosynthesis C-methylase UbiE